MPGQGQRRSRIVLLAVAGFLALQVVIPLRLLPGPFERQFGWQMYSSVYDYRFEVVYEGGRTEPVDPRDHVVRFRSDVAYHLTLPRHLCATLPGAAAVRTASVIAGTDRTRPCR